MHGSNLFKQKKKCHRHILCIAQPTGMMIQQAGKVAYAGMQ